MLFVPIVPPPPSNPSPRTRELEGLLTRVVDEYAKHHPEMTKTEIHEALRRAAPGGTPATPELLRGLIAGAAMLIIVGSVIAARVFPGTVSPQLLVACIASVIVVAFVLKRAVGH